MIYTHPSRLYAHLSMNACTNTPACTRADTLTHTHTRANGLKSYGDLIIIHTYPHPQASIRTHAQKSTAYRKRGAFEVQRSHHRADAR